MRNAVRRPIKIALLCISCMVAAGANAAFAQGSAGGSIGNDEKSLSGTRESPRSVETPARRSKPKPEADEPRRAARKSGGDGGGGGGGNSNFDGVWLVTAAGCGSTTTSTVVITSGRLIFEGGSGTINAAGVSHGVGVYNGVTVTSTGRASGRSGYGTFRTSDGCTGTLTSSKQ
jgi:hypothetical protein